MAKIVLEFDYYTDRELFEDSHKGPKYHNQLQLMWDEMFRPRHKHGYSETRINELLTKPECHELMDLLEVIYRRIKNGEADY